MNSLADTSKVLDKYESNDDAGTTAFRVACDRKSLASSQMNFNLRISLAVMCIVLVEAAKLELFSCWLNKALNSKFEVRLTSWLLKHINDRGGLSAELLAADLHSEDADCNFYLPYHNNNGWNDGRRVLGVTCQDIARCLGILRAVPPLPVCRVEKLLRHRPN